MPRQKQVLTPEQLEDKKQRQREANKRWCLANPEKLKASKKANYQKNIESIKARKAIWRAANKDKTAAYNKEYYARNPEFHSQRFSVWYEANKEKVNARWRKYHADNLDKINKHRVIYRQQNHDKLVIDSANRQKRLKENGGKLSYGIIPKIRKLQKNKCACCKCDLVKEHLDHIIPLALGGSHSDDNIQLLCPFCNQSKHAQHPIDFMQKNGYLL
jgi:5-methylcytosine-specific restriction endonuclease McrA